MLVVVFNCCFIADNISHLNVYYVCYTMLVQRFEPQGRRFTNFHYYYYYSHIGRVHVCLAVICHLHFWRNDRDLVAAGLRWETQTAICVPVFTYLPGCAATCVAGLRESRLCE